LKGEPYYLNQSKRFWAVVRSVSQELGYSKNGLVLIHSASDIATAFRNLGLNQNEIVDHEGNPTPLANDLHQYFDYRASVLNGYVEPRLMDAIQLYKEITVRGQKQTVPANNLLARPYNARSLFLQLKNSGPYTCPLPMNKQKGEKKEEAFFTGIINLLIEKNSRNKVCDYDPRKLTTFTKNGVPVRTFARRVDGAYPTSVNPIAIWEIKEYYYTTTFGSRVADAVYETILDGLEALEMAEHEKINVKHYLMIDSHYTWWECGKPYLCRMIDMLNMGLIDEILFGYEVFERLPELVREWDSQT